MNKGLQKEMLSLTDFVNERLEEIAKRYDESPLVIAKTFYRFGFTETVKQEEEQALLEFVKEVLNHEHGRNETRGKKIFKTGVRLIKRF